MAHLVSEPIPIPQFPPALLRRLPADTLAPDVLDGTQLSRLENSSTAKDMPLPSSAPTLGALLKNLRSREGWTLKQMSAQSGIPVSTLSKVEHDRLTLTYDKLQQLSQRLNMRMSELFAEDDGTTGQPFTARRSLGDLDRSVHVETPNYDYYYLCTELRRKRMIPVLTTIRAKSSEEFGALVKHAGEEYIYVLAGRVTVITEFYDPVVLDEGRSIYIDSNMGHAYLAADGCDEAKVLAVMSSADEDLMQSLLTIHEGQKREGLPTPNRKRLSVVAEPASR